MSSQPETGYSAGMLHLDALDPILDMDYDCGLDQIWSVPIAPWKPAETQISNAYLQHSVHRLRRGPAPSFVYFLLAVPETDSDLDRALLYLRPYIKIGVSTHPLRRLKEIREDVEKRGNGPDWVGAIPADIRIIALFHGDRTTEKFLHQAFAKHRVHGEWFEFDPIENIVVSLIEEFALGMPEALTPASLEDWEWVQV